MARPRKPPAPQWDKTNKKWRWFDSDRKKHIPLGKADSKTDPVGLQEAQAALDKYLEERDGKPASSVTKRATNGIAQHADNEIRKQQRRANKQEVSHDYARKFESAVRRMVSIIGDGPVDRLEDAQTINVYIDAMMDSHLAPKTIKNEFGHTRKFINDLYESGVLDKPPRNIKKLTMKVARKHIKQIFERKELRELHDYFKTSNMGPGGNWELWFLLGLNCGMQEADISDLRVGEWKQVRPKGCSPFMRLERVRTKSKIPMHHCLWKRTWELLQKAAKGKKKGDRVFRRPNGKPLRYETGQSMNHYFPEPWKHIVNEVVPENPLTFKFLRTTGANLCESRLPGSKTAYLSHADQSTAGRFYTNFPIEKLDMVLSYIEKDLRLVDDLVIRSPSMTTNPLRP